MKTLSHLLFVAVLASPAALAHMADDPLLASLAFERLEWRAGPGDDPLAFSLDGWLGRDLHKLHLSAEGEVADGAVHDGTVQLLYGHGVTPFWDVRVGWQGDLRPAPERHWLVLGIEGLAPGWIEVNASLLLGEGRAGLDLDVDHDLRLSRHWVLTPSLEARLYDSADRAAGTGAGLAETELGLRLRYEIRPDLAPYVGIHHQRLHGGSAGYARERDERVSTTSVVVGVRLWF